MEQTLYNVTETAKRLGMSTTTLRRKVKEGKIKPRCGNKYHIDDILKYEGTDTSKLSPFERRRLERENLRKNWKQRRKKMKELKEISGTSWRIWLKCQGSK